MNAFRVDRSDRLRMVFSGDKAKEALGGLVTNDVLALAAGQGQRAAALTPKGRVIALLRVFDRGDDLLVDCEASAAEGFAGMIRKFVNPRLAKYAVITEQTACVGVYGESASASVAAATGVDAATLEAMAAMAILHSGDGTLDVIRSTDFGIPGYDIVGASEAVARVNAALQAAGVPDASPESLEAARIEAGIPAFGIDMDGETIPQEANLDALGAISFNKGCYTGQEVVARIHFRGHVNRHLRLLSASAALPRGATVLDANGKEVGDVRSSVVSPTRGPLALAMIRREVEPGSEVMVRAEGQELSAQVAAIA